MILPASACPGNYSHFSSASDQGKGTAELQKERKWIKELEQELRRKEKALAETAAVLVLGKKANAIWGKDEDE